VHALMAHVREVVTQQSGVVLRAEVRLLGFPGGETGAVNGNGGAATALGGAAQ
jgi:UDP-N-acetylenolpyruvoylglucosamine reductase